MQQLAQDTLSDNLQKSTEKDQDKSKSSLPLLSREQRQNSPITEINTEEGWFAAIGQQRLTETFETAAELHNYMRTENFQFTYICTLATMVYQMNEEEKTATNKQHLTN